MLPQDETQPGDKTTRKKKGKEMSIILQNLRDKGNTHFMNGEYEKAILKYDKALKHFEKAKASKELKPIFKMIWTHKGLALQALRLTSPKHRDSSSLEQLKKAFSMANAL